MTISRVCFFVLIIYGFNSFSQEETEWFPKELNIQPFTANLLEARTGFSYLLGKSSLQLNVGTSSDLIHYSKENLIISAGADFFTYTRLHGSGEFHFPVETIDYFFGINSGYKIQSGNSEYGLRLRISHISAHLVDGSYDTRIDDWRDYKRPRTYSREFIELIPFYRFDGLRIYTGITYIIHTSPEKFGKGIFQAGFDYYLADTFDAFNPFAAYDFRLDKVNKYTGTNTLSAGIKFGEYNRKGFSILYSFISGKSIHGEYFDTNESYSTIGFNLDL